MKSKRVQQVEEVVRRTVAARIPQELPDLAAQVTITRADVSADLRHATLWVGAVGGESAEKAVERLNGLAGAFQQGVAGALATKFTPRIHFRLDTNAQYAEDIERLLQQT